MDYFGVDKKKNGDHFGVGIISGSIWGSFKGWGSFRGRDHFGGCTDVTIEDDQSYAKTTTGSASPSTKDGFVVKVLGLNWNTVSDELFFDFSSLHAYAMSLPQEYVQT